MSGFMFAGIGIKDQAMPKKVRRKRFDIQVSEDTVAAIDDYRFTTRAPSRAEAVRRLLKMGQAAQRPDGDHTARDR
jgi:hypothetical protein